MATKVLSCKCPHDFQDAEYGSGKRLHNKTAKGNPRDGEVWRCTVCKSERRA